VKAALPVFRHHVWTFQPVVWVNCDFIITQDKLSQDFYCSARVAPPPHNPTGAFLKSARIKDSNAGHPGVWNPRFAGRIARRGYVPPESSLSGVTRFQFGGGLFWFNA
jgi:hypothetical protein